MLYEAFRQDGKICFIADEADAQVLVSLFGKCTDDIQCSDTWFKVLIGMGFQSTRVKGLVGAMEEPMNIFTINKIEGVGDEMPGL